jgi:cytochrome P450/NADPH-cytochrome P450 reductase
LRLKLDRGLYLTITPHANASTHLPVNEPVPLLGALAHRVELQDVVTRAQLAALAEHTNDAGHRKTLAALAGDDGQHYREQVLARRKPVLDVLDEFPSCELPFEEFLDMLPSLRG